MNPQLLEGALWWGGGFSVDGDGSARCYGPPGSDALDYLGNAGGPGNWWGLACRADGTPYQQGLDDPAPGFYVSQTALEDPKFPLWSPLRYVDSEEVPYVSIARNLRTPFDVRLGDLAMVLWGGRQIGAIVADVGPAHHYGEGSIALARALGIPESPRDGGCKDGVTWIVFPHSHSTPKWPRGVDEFQGQAERLFGAWGGQPKLQALGVL